MDKIENKIKKIYGKDAIIEKWYNDYDSGYRVKFETDGGFFILFVQERSLYNPYGVNFISKYNEKGEICQKNLLAV